MTPWGERGRDSRSKILDRAKEPKRDKESGKTEKKKERRRRESRKEIKRRESPRSIAIIRLSFPFAVPAIALHYLSTLGALFRARVPVGFDLRRCKVTVQEEMERPDALRQRSTIIASTFQFSARSDSFT